MGQIHFIGGEKGGVGKSFTARLLAQYFIDRGQCFLGFDLDASHGTFSRFYGEFTRTVKVDDFTSLDNLLSTAEAQPDAVLIVDLAAQTATRLGEWIAQSDALNLFKSLGYEVFWWHVLDDGADALRLLDKLVDTYSKQPVHFVVVKNLGRGEDFIGFDESNTHQKILQRNGFVITLERLHGPLAQKIDFNNQSFWSAAQVPNALSLVERQRVKVWLAAQQAQLDRLNLLAVVDA
ncbi:MAG TPA: mobilization protein [Cellvibrionaceae bacterium]